MGSVYDEENSKYDEDIIPHNLGPERVSEAHRGWRRI